MGIFSYLIVMFGIMFWILRVGVALTASMGIEFAIIPSDLNMEIAVLFITLIAFLFIFKRKMIGALIYLIAYLCYFGMDIYKAITENTMGINSFVSIIGILLSVLVFIDIALRCRQKK